VIIAESALIVEYLIEHYGKDTLSPKQWKEGEDGELCGETEEWMRYKYFLHYGEGSLMQYLVVSLIAGSKHARVLTMTIAPADMCLHRNQDSASAFLYPAHHSKNC
jgi:glutathione S-transferase